ncbi:MULTISPECIES: chaplin [unclassified Streptomyces]|uniref:chaplin n=1 Tax=unclassified Streptomyces TaxID=2593676 RepID=UPI00382701B9
MSRIAKAIVLSAAATAAVAGASGAAFASSDADAVAAGSPGVISGNVIQIPLHVPINLCGNTIDVVGILNPAFGNTCVNAG